MMTVLNVVHAVVFVLPLPSKGSNTPKTHQVLFIYCAACPPLCPPCAIFRPLPEATQIHPSIVYVVWGCVWNPGVLGGA